MNNAPKPFSKFLLNFSINLRFVDFIPGVLLLILLIFRNKLKSAFFYVVTFLFFLGGLFRFLEFSVLTSFLAPLTSAMRVSVPILIYLLRRPSDRLRVFLLTACSLTFLGHGLEAFFSIGQFIDFLLYIGRFIKPGLSEGDAQMILKAIGCFDICLAIFICSRFQRKILKLMIFWGFTTACMRIFY
ncbi:MAG: hypothetical protein CME61_05090, partial [Halobacteriovoraceae bacterium]|nr:hypothetical protein [Halobacteriovoraceae bacterium]